MEINVNRLNRLNDLVVHDIKDFESYIYNLLSTVKNMSFSWHDGYTTSFFNQIDNQQEDINDLVNSLYSLSNSLRVIYSYYNSINYSKGDIGTFGIVRDSDFYEKSSDDDEMKARKRRLRTRVLYAEDDVSTSIARVSSPFTRGLDFSNLNLNKDVNGFIGMEDNMENEIRKFKSEIDAFRMYSDRLISNLYSVGNVYNSSNVRRISSKVDSINDSMNRLNTNFNNAYDYIVRRKKEYTKAFEDLADDIRNVG